ncbi:MAG: cobalt-precorrin-5B (C(1))-methyltransferase CbiD [Clostridia bacterium]|nr:cobalt-precorrin-5B (C(1))-methyltransferase CbiD [Clostridia bacterium]
MKPLREGFTTGSCAAACALASCLWQSEGECPQRVEIVTPAGRVYAPQILAREAYACAVIKDSGDDPDVTNGCEVRACVTLCDADGPVCFARGEGVGVITLPGLKLPVGEAAINPVPRRMIEEAVRSVYPSRGATVTVSIVGGERLAKKTFNPRLGVEGGLSVLGTTGIVRPMSEEALTESIRLELSMRRAQGAREIALVFGSQGETALARLGIAQPCVQISNFVGFALDACAELGFVRVMLAGQPGKLAKVAGGCMQTHSRYGDGRRETVAAHLALMGAPRGLIESVMRSVTLDGVIGEIAAQGYARVWDGLCAAAREYAQARTRGEVAVSAIMLDGQGNVLGRA